MPPSPETRDLKAHTFLYSAVPFFFALGNFYQILRGVVCIEVSQSNGFGKAFCEYIGDKFRPDFLLIFIIAPLLTWLVIAKPKWHEGQYRYIIYSAWLLCLLSFVVRYCFYLWIPEAKNF